MTKNQVREALRVIERAAKAKDFEAAHVAEDTLYRCVLEAIARGACEDPTGCARVALESSKIKFARVTA